MGIAALTAIDVKKMHTEVRNSVGMESQRDENRRRKGEP